MLDVRHTLDTGAPDRAALDRLETELLEIATYLDAATHRFLTTLRAFHQSEEWARQGLRSCAQWLSWRIGIDLHTARGYVRVATALESLPVIDEALRRGAVSYSKVRAMVRVATKDNEQLLLELAQDATAAQTEQICAKYAGVLETEQYGPTVATDADKRHVTRRANEDGTVVLRAVLHTDEAEVVWAALTRLAEEQCRTRSAADASPPAQGAARSTTRRRLDRADALVQMAQQVVRGTAPDRSPTEVFLTVPLDVLSYAAETQVTAACATKPPSITASVAVADAGNAEGSAPTNATQVGDPTAADTDRRPTSGTDGVAAGGRHGPSTPAAMPSRPARRNAASDADLLPPDLLPRVSYLGGGLPVATATALRLCCDAGLVPMVEDSAGRPLAVGSKRRTIPAALRRALHKRDTACTFPGCRSQAFLEGHHVEHWAFGGATKLDNLCLLCSYHHRHVHEYGFTIEMTPRGPVFRTPAGTPLESAPTRASTLGSETARLASIVLAEDLDLETRMHCPEGGRADYPTIVDGLVRADGL